MEASKQDNLDNKPWTMYSIYMVNAEKIGNCAEYKLSGSECDLPKSDTCKGCSFHKAEN